MHSLSTECVFGWQQEVEKVFNHNGFKVRIKLLLRPEDVSKALAEYKHYWFDNIEKMLEVMA